jgi:uncharacterized protein YeaO (DUF488 family)
MRASPLRARRLRRHSEAALRRPTISGTPRRRARRVRSRGRRCVVRLKRAYDAPSPADGMRVLVDRLWPRGLARDQLAIDFWLKDAAPSAALRRWYGHVPRRWRSFAAKYRAELERRPDALRLLDELRRRGPVTLIYGARDPERNNAVVLRDTLEARRRTGRRTQKGGVAAH